MHSSIPVVKGKLNMSQARVGPEGTAVQWQMLPLLVLMPAAYPQLPRYVCGLMGHPFGWLTKEQNKTLNWPRQSLKETGVATLVEQLCPGKLGNHGGEQPLAWRRHPESTLVICFIFQKRHLHGLVRCSSYVGRRDTAGRQVYRSLKVCSEDIYLLGKCHQRHYLQRGL